MRALRIAISGSIFSTSLVSREPRGATVCVHLGEVKSTVKAAGKVRDIHVESEFLVLQVEKLILSFAGHKVDARTDVGGEGAVSDELEREGVTAGRDTVRANVICTVEGTVGSASGGVWAETGVPFVAGIAVSAAGSDMEVSPVGVKHNRG